MGTKIYKINRELRKTGTNEHVSAKYQLGADNCFPWNDFGKHRESITCPYSVVAVSYDNNIIETAILRGPDITPIELHCLVNEKVVNLDEVQIKRVDPYRVDFYWGMSGCVEYSIETLKRVNSKNMLVFSRSKEKILHMGHLGTLSWGFEASDEGLKIVASHLGYEYQVLGRDIADEKCLNAEMVNEWYRVNDPGVDFGRYNHYATSGYYRTHMQFVKYDAPEGEEIEIEKFISFTEVQPIVESEQDLVAQGFIIPDDYWATDLPHNPEAQRLYKKKPVEVRNDGDDINVEVAEVVEVE